MGDNKVYAFSPTVLLIFYILRYGYIIKILFKSKKIKAFNQGIFIFFQVGYFVIFFIKGIIVFY
jgi:hypothetical protein